MSKNPHTELRLRAEFYVNSRADARVFNNPVGFDAVNQIAYGLCPGSHDLIGVQKVLIKPAMVGLVIGRLVSMDAKTGKASYSPKQRVWHNFVTEFGGVAGIVTDRNMESDIERILQWKNG